MNLVIEYSVFMLKTEWCRGTSHWESNNEVKNN